MEEVTSADNSSRLNKCVAPAIDEPSHPDIATIQQSGRMECPNCRANQPRADMCESCGIVIQKYFKARELGIPMKSAAYSDGSRPGILMKSATP